jgi:hypothetical protein
MIRGVIYDCNMFIVQATGAWVGSAVGTSIPVHRVPFKKNLLASREQNLLTCALSFFHLHLSEWISSQVPVAWSKVICTNRAHVNKLFRLICTFESKAWVIAAGKFLNHSQIFLGWAIDYSIGRPYRGHKKAQGKWLPSLKFEAYTTQTWRHSKVLHSDYVLLTNVSLGCKILSATNYSKVQIARNKVL